LKKIKNEIEELMCDLKKQDGVVTSHFVFPESFIGFQGHFPKHKILPGVCQIQCALSTLERALQRPIALREVALAKYFVPVLPGEEIACVCSDMREMGEFTFKTVISKGPAKVAELKLRVACSAGEKNPK
jgi:3-hydroxyacyl-[acyl-carrier-protein] dehydratase